jgi:hypothetical protein
MRRCFIDATTSHGITGWAVGSRQDVPCRLRIESDGRPLAQAVARGFRRDLLDAGIGHGHYGFTARFETRLPLAEHMFSVFEVGVDEIMPGNCQDVFMLAGDPPAAPMRVEELLEQVDHWTDDDLLRHVGLLKLDANMAAMGVARFVDVTFKYTLARWADPADAHSYGKALRDNEITPDGCFRTLLMSEERRTVHMPLVSPYDSQFPYELS